MLPTPFIRCRVPRRAFVVVTATAWVASWLGGDARGAEPAVMRRSATAPRSRTVVDGAVLPAGGPPCEACDPNASGPPGGHLAECRDGLCAPHCPVRPSQYGFYRTQWRRWPGQGVVPASAEEAATPAVPPASQIPTSEEESPRSPESEPTPPDDGAGALPTDPLPELPADTDPVAPVEQPPLPPTPPGEPPVEAGPTEADTTRFDGPDVHWPPATPAEAGGMRYPATIGRSVAAGSSPWRLRRSAP